MLDKDYFTEQMKRLELANGRMLPNGSYRIWWEVMCKRGFSSESLKEGIDSLIESDNAFPRLSDLIKHSGAKYREERAKKLESKRRENAKREDKDWQESAEKTGGQIAKDCIALIRKLHFGHIDGDGYYQGMCELHEKYPQVGFKAKAEIYIREHKRDKTRTVLAESTPSEFTESMDARSLSDRIGDENAG